MMIKVLVTLQVKDFKALEKFERKAVDIMKKHQGKLLSAFETSRNSDGSGEEIHLLEFTNQQMFDNYRSDKALLPWLELREQAISKTEIKISLTNKSYE